jgi:hypothetical protein
VLYGRFCSYLRPVLIAVLAAAVLATTSAGNNAWARSGLLSSRAVNIVFSELGLKSADVLAGLPKAQQADLVEVFTRMHARAAADQPRVARLFTKVGSYSSPIPIQRKKPCPHWS